MFPTLPSHFLNVPSRGYRILLAGGPASGKGTQSELLRSILGVVHISTGELLRDERKLGTELGTFMLVSFSILLSYHRFSPFNPLQCWYLLFICAHFCMHDAILSRQQGS